MSNTNETTNQKVTVRFGRIIAYVSGGRWFCASEDVRASVQRVSDAVSVPASAPDMDNYLANEVATVLGGRVTRENEADTSPDESPPLVY